MAEKEGRVNIIITAKDKTGDAFGSASKSFAGLGKTAVLGAGVAVAAAGAAVVGVVAKSASAFVQFEDQMNEVFTLLPDISGEAMAAMRDQVKDASVDMGRMPEEIIPALYQSLSAGVPQDNVFDFLATAHQAALGGVTDLETAVDGISSVVNAYGVDVMDATQASDLMFTAVRLGKTDFGQLSGSLSKVTPIASAMGISFADVTAGLAAITAKGTPTAVATTQMSRLFQELGDSGTEVSGIFEEISGQSFLDFIAEGGNVAQVLSMLEQNAAETGVPLQDMFGSIQAGMAALQLTGSGMDIFEGNLEEMQNAAGATEAAYDVMNSGMARSFEVMQATVETIMLDIGEAVAPVVAWLSGKLLGAFEALQPYIDIAVGALEEFLDVVGPLVEEFGLVEGVLYAVEEALDSFLPEDVMEDVYEFSDLIINDVVPAIQSFINKVVEFAQPIIDTVAQFVSWKDILIALGIAVAAFVLPIIGSIITTLAPIILAVVAVIGVISLLRNAWENDWGGIRTKLTEAWENTIRPALEQLVEWLQVNVPIAIAALKEFWENVLLPAIRRVWEFISGTLIPILVEIATSVFETVKAAIQGLSDFWTNTLLPAIQDVWAFIQNDLIPLFNALVQFFDAAFTLAITAMAGLWQNVLQPAFEAVWGFIKKNLLPIIKSLLETGINALKLAVRGFEILWSTVFKPALEAVWRFIQENLLPILQELIEKVRDKLQPAIDAVKVVFDAVKKAITDVSGAIQGAISWIGNLANKLNSIELPWWLTPGSPTPFEYGLVGIAEATAKATRELGRMESRLMTRTVDFGFNSTFSGIPTGQYSGNAGAFGSNRTTNNEFHLHVGTTATAGEDISQYERMKAMVIE